MEKQIIGTMSGTSMDGVDVALLKTDGEGLCEPGATHMRPYNASERAAIRDAAQSFGQDGAGNDDLIRSAEDAVTNAHIEAISALMEAEDLTADDIDLVGFHGQTLFHAPDKGVTVQTGDAKRLVHALATDVVHDFRTVDVAAGGEGAPLVPIFHKVLVTNAAVEGPVAVVNIGGVANATIIDGDDLIAFDTGPGSALIDDWIRSRTSKTFDQWGRIAGEGRVNEIIVNEMLADPYFDRQPPKSLDRDTFSWQALDRVSLADGAASLTAFSARSIAKGLSAFGIKTCFVTGGGAHNRTMMRMLTEASGLQPQPMDLLGLDGDFVEAYAFAYLAARVAADLPITFPGTTGVATPLTGGSIERKP
ncbi:MAG: anhydro-N-acetylmuramic acid kinase [Pseudomonadota bacterium]